MGLRLPQSSSITLLKDRPKSMAGVGEGNRRFTERACIARNVVKYYELFKDDFFYYAIMELCDHFAVSISGRSNVAISENVFSTILY